MIIHQETKTIYKIFLLPQSTLLLNIGHSMQESNGKAINTAPLLFKKQRRGTSDSNVASDAAGMGTIGKVHLQKTWTKNGSTDVLSIKHRFLFQCVNGNT